jgi:hypothetical protein
MPYTPPAGFIEQIQAGEGERLRSAFHMRPDCPRVHNVHALRPSSRPYSAVRCTLCAPE